MRLFLIVIALFAVFNSKEPEPEKIILSLDETVSVHFPEDFEMDGLQINFLLTGSFGGYGSFVRTKPDVRSYEIPTSNKGKPAETLKIIVFSPHYRIKVFDFPTLENRKEKIEIKPERSKTIRFLGKVLLPKEPPAGKIRLQVSYTADWKCDFFGLDDCLLAGFPIASVGLDEDGSFRVDLPDFAGDEAIVSFKDTGRFHLDLHDERGRLVSALKLKDDPKYFGIQAATTYPNEKVFILGSSEMNYE